MQRFPRRGKLQLRGASGVERQVEVELEVQPNGTEANLLIRNPGTEQDKVLSLILTPGTDGADFPAWPQATAKE